MIRRHGTPRFVSVTNVVLFVVVAAVGLKVAARYLPERQPNRLIVEYGSYVHEAARSRLDWYPFSDEAFRKARKDDRLILLEIGSLLSRSSNILTHSYFNDSEYARLLNSHFVCVRADTHEIPGLADAIALNAPFYQEAEGSLLMILDPDGRPVAETPFRKLRVSAGPPAGPAAAGR